MNRTVGSSGWWWILVLAAVSSGQEMEQVELVPSPTEHDVAIIYVFCIHWKDTITDCGEKNMINCIKGHGNITRVNTCVSHTHTKMYGCYTRIGVRFVAAIAHKKCVIYAHLF